MRKFNSVEAYNEFLRVNGYIELDEFELNDFAAFVNGRDYEICLTALDCGFDEDIVFVDGKYYWMSCVYVGIRFIEVDQSYLDVMSKS